MKRLKLGVIGTGMAWNRLHLPVIEQLQEQFEVTALVDVDQGTLKKSSERLELPENCRFTDYHKMLGNGNIDVVDVAVPIHLNYQVARDVAAAGYSMICEKPLAPSLEEAVDFLKLEEKYGVQILIAENYRYNEEVEILKNLVHSEKAGQIKYFVRNHANNFEEEMKQNSFSVKEWRQHPVFRGGIFLDSVVHDVAALRYIFGGIGKVSGFGMEEGDDYSYYSTISASLQFHSGVLGSLLYNTKVPDIQRPSVGLRIYGTEGTIYLEDKFCGIVNIFYKDGSHEMIPFQPEQGYYNEFLNLYHAIAEGKKIHSTPMVEFGDMKCIFDILEAIQSGRVIDVMESTKFMMAVKEEDKINS